MALHDELRGDWELEEVLKLDVAASIKETRRGEIDGADTPQTECDDDCVGAKAARREASGDAIEPVIHLSAAFECVSAPWEIPPPPEERLRRDDAAVMANGLAYSGGIGHTHGAGSAFFNASSMDCPERRDPSITRHP